MAGETRPVLEREAPEIDELKLIDRFEEVVHRHSGRPAIRFDDTVVTYGDLNAGANRLAHLILDRGGERGDRVALIMEHGPGLFATMLAVLKAARICVILDPKDPPDRLRQIMSDAEPVLIVADASSRSVAVAVALGAPTIALGDESAHALTNPALDIAPDEIAFLVYTSGSTGRPKAVMKSHGHVLLQPLTAGREMAVTPDDRILMLAALSGGQGVNTTWIALANGAELVAFPAGERGVTGLADCIADIGITILVSSAALFRAFMKTIEPRASFPRVRLATLAGDAATWQDFALFRDHFPNGRLVTAFAASEAGYITLLTLDRDQPPGEGPLPVGRPCSGREVRILDEHGQECAPGTVGMIEVRGPHLASGYWRDPARTAETFPVLAGHRVFRSSDLGLFADDGSLLLRGRGDAAIKIRGHRVDLTEVEKALADFPGVAEVAAGTIGLPNGELRLVAYIVPDGPDGLVEGRLRTVARATMARHLIPSSFVFLERLPTTPNGKVDRGKLRDIRPAAERRTTASVTSTTEFLLARLWGEAFETADIGASDDFFDLGGDSLVAAEIAARVHSETGVAINLGTFADTPVLADMAALIDARRNPATVVDDAPIVRVPRDQPILASFSQKHMWRATRAPRKASHLNVGSTIRINGPLDAAILGRSIDHVVGRHESLRTRFVVENGELFQVIEPPAPVTLPLVDVSEAPDPDAAVRQRLLDRLDTPFALEAAPPVRFELLRLAPSQYRLLRVNHHIISDAPSWNMFTREIAAAYEAFASGSEPSLPPVPFQYADYAAWQRERWRPDGSRFRSTMDWWKDQLAGGASPDDELRRLRIVRARPATDGPLGDQSVSWGLDEATANRLDQIARTEMASYYSTRLATLAPLMADMTGRDRVVVGGYFTRRARQEFARTFGLLVDRVPIVLRYDRNVTFRRFLGNVRRCIAETSIRADVPSDVLRDAMAAENVPMPRDPYLVQMPTQVPKIRFAGLELDADQGVRVSRFGIQFWFDQVRETRGGCSAYYDGRLFDPDGMSDFVADLVRFSAIVAKLPDITIGDAVTRARAG